MEYYNPVHIYADTNGAAHLAALATEYETPGASILLITRGMDFLQSSAYEAIKKALAPFTVIEEAISVSNPDVKDVAAMLDRVKGNTFSLIIAIGGGTVMDTAKTLAMALPAGISGTEELRDFIVKGTYTGLRPIPWVGVPTTAGTGSEVTSWATVWDRDKECKRSCSWIKNYAVAAVLDPAFTVTCPLGLTVSSALDAICHSTESFWSRHTNEVSQQYALLAIQHIRQHLEALTQDLHNMDLRLTIAKASLFAGLAFSNTKTTVCHSVSYPLTEKFGIPHGTAAVLTLGDFLAFNKPAISRYDELLQAFGCSSAADVKTWLYTMLQRGGFSTRLRDYGVTKDDLPYIVDHAFTKGRADNNPVPVTAEAVKQVLETIF